MSVKYDAMMCPIVSTRVEPSHIRIHKVHLNHIHPHPRPSYHVLCCIVTQPLVGYISPGPHRYLKLLTVQAKCYSMLLPNTIYDERDLSVVLVYCVCGSLSDWLPRTLALTEWSLAPNIEPLL